MQELYAQGRIIQTRTDSVPRYKRYLDEMPGIPLQDVWDDILPLGAQAIERLGYPTQKPLTLLERIIQTSSKPGDVVLDPFGGCGTATVTLTGLAVIIPSPILPLALQNFQCLSKKADKADSKITRKPPRTLCEESPMLQQNAVA